MAPVWLSSELPGSGGKLYPTPQDFEVDEVLAYPLSGEGEHLLVRFEKTGLTTPEAVQRIARAAGVAPHQVGYAGMKDKNARTRQWLSFQHPIKAPLPDLSAAESDALQILERTRHGNKLKRGHQRSNRFTITLREVPSGGLLRAQAVLELLRSLGVPNAFGPQRFGRDGDNPEQALKILRGEDRGPRDRRVRSILFSSLQSLVFNRVLEMRIQRGLFATALAGDVMQKHANGGMFDSSDPIADQPRIEALEISPTAALPGRRARLASGVPAAMEAEALLAVGLSDRDLDPLEGTRRLLRFPLDPDATLEAIDDSSYRLSVALPSGAFATVLLGELMKPERGAVLRETEVSEEDEPARS